MSYTLLVDALKLALSNVGDSLADPSRADWANFGASDVAPFAKALAEAPQFQNLWGRMVVTPDSGTRLDAESTASYLISRARSGYSAEVIIKDLLRFAVTGEVDFHSVWAITNVEVTDRIALSSDAALLPRSALPPGLGRDLAFYRSQPMGKTGRVLSGLTALVITTKISTLRDLPPQKLPFQAPLPEEMAIESKFQSKIDDAYTRSRIALVLVGGCSPDFGASYGYVSSPGWPTMPEAGVGFYGAPPQNNPRIFSEQTPEMQRVFDIARSADETILLAIDHLAAARTCQSDAERAIEIGTCFEILLMHRETSGNTEISSKISHRGAWLIGNGSDDRLRVYTTIKKGYDLRSKAIHAGKLRAVRNVEEHSERQQFFVECETIIGNLIERLMSGWPAKWDDVTLSLNG